MPATKLPTTITAKMVLVTGLILIKSMFSNDRLFAAAWVGKCQYRVVLLVLTKVHVRIKVSITNEQLGQIWKYKAGLKVSIKRY